MNDIFNTKLMSDRELIQTFFDSSVEAKEFFMVKIKDLENQVKIGNIWFELRKKSIAKEKDEMTKVFRFGILTELNRIYRKYRERIKQLAKFKRLYLLCDKCFVDIRRVDYEKDIDQEKVEYARNYPIRRLLERFCEPRKNTCICPFHKETLPSLHIYDHNNSYYCFGCKAGGDPIDFIMRLRGYNFKEAVGFINNF